MRSSMKPYGSLAAVGGGKINLMNFTVLPDPGQASYTWAYMWGAGYDAARNLQWLQTTKAQGFNAVRIMSSNSPFDGPSKGVNDWPPIPLFRQRAAEFAQRCRELGLRILVCLSGSATCPFGITGRDGPTIIPGIVAYAQVWVEVARDVLLYFDAANEINNIYYVDPRTLAQELGPVTWPSPTAGVDAIVRRDCDYYIKALRTVTQDVPLTISITTSGGGDLVPGSKGWFDLQYDLSCDLHDMHLYWSEDDQPTVSHFQQFAQRDKYLGAYVVGEFGTNQTFSASRLNTLFRNVGDIARLPDCLGIGLWALTPQSTSPGLDLGYCSDVAGTMVRPEKAVHARDWPAY